MVERDAIRLYRSVKMSALADSWAQLPETHRNRFRFLAADAVREHSVPIVDPCVCGELDCAVRAERAMFGERPLPKWRPRPEGSWGL